MSSSDTPAGGFRVQSASTQQLPGVSAPPAQGVPRSAAEHVSDRVPPAAPRAAATPSHASAGGSGQLAPAAPRSRRARLVLSRIDPWSVTKLAFMLSIALGIMLVVAVVVIWSLLDAMGVFTSLSNTLQDLTSNEAGGGFDLLAYVGFNRVVGTAALIALVDMVLLTALSTLAAFMYNITASLVGGLHVTLSEDV